MVLYVILDKYVMRLNKFRITTSESRITFIIGQIIQPPIILWIM